jgi:hypothetical protein
MHSAQSQVSVPAMLGDTGRTLRINLSDGSNPYTIAVGCLAKITIKRPTGTHLEEFCTIENGTTIVYPFSQNTNTCAVEGIHDCDITLYGTDGNRIASPRFSMVVNERVGEYDDLVVKDEDRTFLEATLAEAASILSSVKIYAEQAKADAEMADARALDAVGYCSRAQVYSNWAKEYAERAEAAVGQT